MRLEDSLLGSIRLTTTPQLFLLFYPLLKSYQDRLVFSEKQKEWKVFGMNYIRKV